MPSRSGHTCKTSAGEIPPLPSHRLSQDASRPWLSPIARFRARITTSFRCRPAASGLMPCVRGDSLDHPWQREQADEAYPNPFVLRPDRGVSGGRGRGRRPAAMVPGWARINPERLPTWARFGGRAPAAEDAGLFCKEHGVPEKFCTLCHEELADKLMLCKEHGNIPEDICTHCHPEVAKKYNIEMCKGHGLPEHFCVECGKGPSASRPARRRLVRRPQQARGPVRRMCPGTGQGAAAADGENRHRQGVPPAPADRPARVGQTRPAGRHPDGRGGRGEARPPLVANAETAYDANHYAEISPRVAGFIREVRVDLGQAVRQGDVLAVVDSAEVSAAKAQFLSSQAALKLAQATAEPDAVARPDRGGRRQGRARGDDGPEPGPGRRHGRRAEAPQPRLRRRGAGPDPQDQGHEEPPQRRRPDRRDGGRAARRQGRGGPADVPTVRRRRHLADVALDRRVRERHRQGEARPGGGFTVSGTDPSKAMRPSGR